ncbi:MAG: 4-(cytidine 5'-diphospho)-2-C-methyl-D-erythritol kinase [Acetobacteraceae bacterium]|nr:4-(cytidine 5'-diphospho)-2-C-methyl-D-erythritol kinase [Acetobacteraceae bacterium]
MSKGDGGAVVEAARAKVNLFLHVLGRRADGYHLLELACRVRRGRRSSSAPNRPRLFRFRSPGRSAGGLEAGEDNLVLRAARSLAAATGTVAGARLTLDKRLPVAAGIGGGSADAAATLRALNRLWGLGLDHPRLAAIALALGADVPVCLGSRAVRMGGIGEVLAPAPRLPRFGLLLANPGIPLATATVFAARAGPFDPPADLPEGWPDAIAMAKDLARFRNGLEAAARALCPPLAEVLDALSALPGALLARLSGSGPTAFALLATAEEAVLAAARLRTTYPAWWIAAGEAGG